MWYHSFLWIHTAGNSSTAPVFSYNQINKQPENLYVDYRERFSYFTQLPETSLFNNAILHLNEIIKKRTLSSFEIILERVLKVFALHSAMREPSLSVRVENHGNDWLTSTKTQVEQREKTRRGRVLVVTAVTFLFNSQFTSLVLIKIPKTTKGWNRIWAPFVNVLFRPNSCRFLFPYS